MKPQENRWARRVSNIKIEADASPRFLRTKRDMTRRGISIHQCSIDTIEKQENLVTGLKATRSFGQGNDEITSINRNPVELDQTIQGQNERFEKQNIEIMILKKELEELKKVIEDSDMRSLKTELKNVLQMQKDAVNSNLSIKKEFSGIKRQLNMVYGTKFFDPK